MEHLPKRSAKSMEASPERERYVAFKKTERCWGNEECFDIRHEIQNLEFTLMTFGLALVRYFLILLPLLPFGMTICILCHFILEVCDPLIDFDFIGGCS